MKKSITVWAFMFTVLCATAQTDQHKTHKSPQERANKVTEEMVKDFGISEEQKTKVQALALKRAETVSAIKMKGKEEKKAHRADMKKANEEFEKELKTVLTPEQFTKWEAKKKQMKEKRKERRKNNSKDSETPKPATK